MEMDALHSSQQSLSPTSVSKELLRREKDFKLVGEDEAIKSMDDLAVDGSDSPTSALQTLLHKEEEHYRSQSLQELGILFAKEHSESPKVLDWFTGMTDWCCSVADGCKLPPQTVEVAMNILDRYLLCTFKSKDPYSRQSISFKPKENNIFRSSSKFQLVVVTCLHIASKSDAFATLTPELLETLCRKEIAARDIETMAMKILSTLKFQVNPPTVISFAQEIERELQIWSRNEEVTNEQQLSLFLLLVEQQARLATKKLYPFHVRASSIALACVKNALLVMEAQSLLETDFDSVSSPEFQKALRPLGKEILLSSGMTEREFVYAQERLQSKLRRITRQSAFEWKQKNRDSDSINISPQDFWASSSSMRVSSRSLSSINEEDHYEEEP